MYRGSWDEPLCVGGDEVFALIRGKKKQSTKDVS